MEQDMEVKRKSKKLIEVWEIDYKNGVKCEYTITNKKLGNVFFTKNKQSLTYVDNIDEFRNAHFSNHHKLIKAYKPTVTDLYNFTEFDKLYYIGGHMDGMTKDVNGVFISTPIIMDPIFFQCWLHIEKKKEKCQIILDSLDKEYIIKSNIEQIPDYNWSERKNHHYTLNLTVKLPDDLYNEFVGAGKYIDDEVRIKIFNYLKKKNNEHDICSNKV